MAVFMLETFQRPRSRGGASAPPIMLEKNFVCKLLLVNPATSATGERPFSMTRRVKTWLRANMK